MVTGFASIIHDCVGIASDVTSSLQTKVNHAAISRVSPGGALVMDSEGNNSWDAPIVRNAIIVSEQKLIRAADGSQKVSTQRLTILDPGVLVDLLDKFTTLDSSPLGPILAIENMADPDGVAYYNKVML